MVALSRFRLVCLPMALVPCVLIAGAWTSTQPKETPASISAEIPTTSSLAGAYLSANAAMMHNDAAAAAQYTHQLWQANKNSTNNIAEKALGALLAADKQSEALQLAEEIVQQKKNSLPAQLTLAVRDAQKQNFAEAATRLEPYKNTPLGRILQTWFLFAQKNNPTEREAVIRQLVGAANNTTISDGGIMIFHAALMTTVNNKPADARQMLQSLINKDNTVLQRLTMRAADIEVQLKNIPQAQEILTRAVERNNNPLVRSRLDHGEKESIEPLDIAHGIAEALLTGASIFTRDGEATHNFIYAQACVALAQQLAPNMPAAQMLRAELATEDSGMTRDINMQRFAGLYNQPIYGGYAVTRHAIVLHRAERFDEALALLKSQQNADKNGKQLMILSTKGDVLRDNHHYKEAVEAYAQAIAMAQELQVKFDNILYARGTAYERLGDWSKAEEDLRAALKTQPNNAQILNYLGYSLADRGLKLEEAQEMLQRATALEPDSGYIIDSLGWVYFKRGNYDAAVTTLEQAVALTPNDDAVHEHLGDAYAKVGRTREALFEWTHALSFVDDDAEGDKQRLQKKINEITEQLRAREL